MNDSDIMGLYSLRIDNNGEVCLDLLAVDEKYRRCGVGKYLVKHACAIGNATYLKVRPNNHTAIALYEECGFVKGINGGETIIMRRQGNADTSQFDNMNFR